MFLENKYTRWYFAIVDNARRRLSHSGYIEKHHIIPESMGGTDALENLVSLAAREHFICHLLLAKMTTGRDLMKMRKALRYMMCVPQKMHGLRWIPTGRTVEIARKEAALANKGNREIAVKISKSHTGKMLSEEHKRKIAVGLMGTVKSIKAAKASGDKQRGQPKSEVTKEKMRLAWISRRERKAAGLEPRAEYSEQALANMRAAAITRGARQRALNMAEPGTAACA